MCYGTPHSNHYVTWGGSWLCTMVWTSLFFNALLIKLSKTHTHVYLTLDIVKSKLLHQKSSRNHLQCKEPVKHRAWAGRLINHHHRQPNHLCTSNHRGACVCLSRRRRFENRVVRCQFAGPPVAGGIVCGIELGKITRAVLSHVMTCGMRFRKR